MRPSLMHERRHADGTARRKGSGLDIDSVMRDFVVDCAVEHHSGVHVDSLPCRRPFHDLAPQLTSRGILASIATLRHFTISARTNLRTSTVDFTSTSTPMLVRVFSVSGERM